MAPTKERPATKTIATNREARHEYFVLEALRFIVISPIFFRRSHSCPLCTMSPRQ